MSVKHISIANSHGIRTLSLKKGKAADGHQHQCITVNLPIDYGKITSVLP